MDKEGKLSDYAITVAVILKCLSNCNWGEQRLVTSRKVKCPIFNMSLLTHIWQIIIFWLDETETSSSRFFHFHKVASNLEGLLERQNPPKNGEFI